MSKTGESLLRGAREALAHARLRGQVKRPNLARSRRPMLRLPKPPPPLPNADLMK